MLSLDENALLEKVGRDLSFILDVKQPPDDVRIVRWQQAIPQYVVGHLDRVKRIEERLLSFPGLHLTGAGYHGVGVNDCIRNSGVIAGKIAAPRS